MRKRKAYNPLKQAESLARASFKNRVIGCVPGYGPCQFLDLKQNKVISVGPKTFKLISELRHKWTVFIAVIGRDQDNKPYMKSKEIAVVNPQFQADMVSTLNEHHQKMIAEFNSAHLLSAGWLAAPYEYEFDEQHAFKLLEELGALKFERVSPNEFKIVA